MPNLNRKRELMNTPSLKELAQWADREATVLDTFGPTDAGDMLRLIASVLTQFESSIMPRLEHLSSELGRIERAIHNV